MVVVNPKHYKIHLEPDLSSFRFDGITEILIEAEDDINEVVLNVNDLALWSCKAKDKEDFVDCNFSINPNEQKVTVNLPDFMNNIELKIEYTGKINDLMVGFYRSKYEHEGKVEYIAVTQFEEIDARRAFPCYDHPSKKATFDIEFIIDENLTGISNTPIIEEEDLGDGRKRIKFETTPKMSTYLLFFGVGDFEFIEDSSEEIVFRLATTPGKTKYGEFGLEFSKKCINYGEEYTGIKFPIKKMDQIAVPDFAHGAMENYAAITYRENLLLVYPGITSKAGLETIAEVIAHEIAHMWFGNLVSPSDWKYYWLNESFATLFGFVIADHYYPDWGIWNQFLVDEVNGAFERDSLVETLPIELPGEGDQVKVTPATAPIIYSKGGAILQMIKGYIGEDNFKKGVNQFLKKYEFKCASTNEYFIPFDKAIGAPISDMMKTWVYQPGYPLVEAKRENNELVLSQKRFSFLNQHSDQLWMIPITISFYNGINYLKTEKILLDERTTITSIPEGSSVFKINVEQTGFYRVKYEKESLKELGKLVINKILSPKDRYGLQNDLYALVRSGDYSIDEYLNFMNHYENEDAYLPLINIAGNLIHAYNVIESKREKISAIGRKIFTQVLDKIGYEPKDDDLHTISLLRSNLLWVNFRFDDKHVAEFGSEKFKDLMEGKSVHPDILANIMRIGAASDDFSYEWFIKKFESPETEEQERLYILGALGSFNNKNTIFKALSYTMENVPSGNKIYPIVYAAGNLEVIDQMWLWYQENLLQLEKLHQYHYETVITSVVSLSGLGREAEVKNFFEKYMNERESAKDSIKMTLERLEINSRLRES